jgi:multiple sugar transport system ATP-binding protein
MASVTLKGISKRFGEVTALSKVNLYVEDGEFCVLLGPSGCGKSTLLQIVAGLTRQDEGSVLVDDRPVDRLSPRERDVAMVFQTYALIEKQITEAARFLGIQHLLDRKPRQLSGGQRQRVAMGRALVRRPRLFLLDEPLSNLDAQLRISVRLELKRLHEQILGTVLYVTHDQVEAMTLGDKVVVLREGRVHQIGRPETIYDKPEDTFVATFIGSPEMNLFKGKLVKEEGLVRFRNADLDLNPGEIWADLADSEVELGIRPEDIEIRREPGRSIQAEVDLLSNVGADKVIHTRRGETLITVRAPKETSYNRGEKIPLFIHPSKIHLFKEGRRIEI